MTSRMSYFSDRILRPENLRSMALMYLANSPVKPDLQNDFYLSPILAPEVVLSQFPKTYIICGEKDPLIDDTGRTLV
jgi:acetyl esterase/lipase